MTNTKLKGNRYSLYEIGGFIQTIKGEKITCNCMYMQNQMSGRKNFRHWKDCKHIACLRKMMDRKNRLKNETKL